MESDRHGNIEGESGNRKMEGLSGLNETRGTINLDLYNETVHVYAGNDTLNRTSFPDGPPMRFCAVWEEAQHSLFQSANMFLAAAFIVPKNFKQNILLVRYAETFESVKILKNTLMKINYLRVDLTQIIRYDGLSVCDVRTWATTAWGCPREVTKSSSQCSVTEAYKTRFFLNIWNILLGFLTGSSSA